MNFLTKIHLALLFTYLIAESAGSGLAEDAGVSWPTPDATFYIGNLSGANGLWKSTFEEAALRWNDTATQFKFNTTRASGSGYCSNLGDNNVRFSATNCGDAWGSSALGITAFWSKGSELTKVDISFNNNRNWNVYDGNKKAFAVDFRRVAAHELGHAVGLAHSASSNALMFASASNTYLPTPGDVNSLAIKYGSKAHTLTIRNLGSGGVTILPKVDGTSVIANNISYTSNYSAILDCRKAICQIPVQGGLRLTMTAQPEEGAVFVSWDGTTIRDETVALAPFYSDRELVANFSYLDSSGDNNTDPATRL
jgi:hypothetical protein